MATDVEISARVRLPAPAEHVWQAVTDWSRQREWMLGTTARGGHGIGASVRARTGIGPVGFTDSMVITEWEPPCRCVVRHTGRFIRGSGVFEVSPAGDGSELGWTERLSLPLGTAGRWGWRAVRPLAQRGMNASLRRFTRTQLPAS